MKINVVSPIAVFTICRHLRPQTESHLVSCLSELFGIFLIVAADVLEKKKERKKPARLFLSFLFLCSFFFVNVCKLFAVSNIPYITAILPRPLDLVVVCRAY